MGLGFSRGPRRADPGLSAIKGLIFHPFALSLSKPHFFPFAERKGRSFDGLSPNGKG
jgi:hypothetical protein